MCDTNLQLELPHCDMLTIIFYYISLGGGFQYFTRPYRPENEKLKIHGNFELYYKIYKSFPVKLSTRRN